LRGDRVIRAGDCDLGADPGVPETSIVEALAPLTLSDDPESSIMEEPWLAFTAILLPDAKTSFMPVPVVTFSLLPLAMKVAAPVPPMSVSPRASLARWR
jgi:hypothetical protein